MKPAQALKIHREAVRRIVVTHNVRNPRVFGSAAHGQDTEASDFDLLIDPAPETSLFDVGPIRSELLQLLGVRVDVLTPKSLPEDFRAEVVSGAVPV